MSSSNGTLTHPARVIPVANLRSWRAWPLPNANLPGHPTVAFFGCWTVRNVPAFWRSDGSLSAGGPSAPIIDRDGRQKLYGAGKQQYQPIIGFQNAGRERWQGAILATLAEGGINPGAVS